MILHVADAQLIFLEILAMGYRLAIAGGWYPHFPNQKSSNRDPTILPVRFSVLSANPPEVE
jgi:hypothetical protein